MALTALADAEPDQVRALVYLDALLPNDGDSSWSMTDDSEHEWYQRLLRDGQTGDRPWQPWPTAPKPILRSLSIKWDTTQNVLRDGPDRLFDLIIDL